MLLENPLTLDMVDGDGYPEGEPRRKDGAIMGVSSCPVTSMSPPPGLPSPSSSCLPSRGSALHHTGDCKPCAWFWKPSGCQNGQECLHCHLCPKEAKAIRKKIKQAERRADAHTSAEQSLTQTTFENNPNEFELTSPPRLEHHSSTLGVFDTELERLTMPAGLHLESVPMFYPAPLESELDVDMPSPCVLLGRSADLALISSSTSGPLVSAGSHFPSRGAELHPFGRCRPCGWFWKPGGCVNGQDCNHCHSCPEGALKARKKAKKGWLQ